MARTNTPTILVGNREVETPGLLAYLLSLANDFRRANNGDPLAEIPRSAPGNPRECIIANALNFGCMVFPVREDDEGTPMAAFKALEHAERFQLLTHAEYILDKRDLDEPFLGEWRYEVPLTPELNAIALAFDRGALAELESGDSRFLRGWDA